MRQLRAEMSRYVAADLGSSIVSCMHSSGTIIEAKASGEVDACTDSQDDSGRITYRVVWDGMLNRYTTKVRVEWKLVGGTQSGRTVLISDHTTVNAEPGCIKGSCQVLEGDL